MRRLLLSVFGAAVVSIALPTAAGDQRLVDAAKRHDARTVQALLKQGVDVNATHANFVTALHWAAHWDDVATADLLLGAGARVNVEDDTGVTPLVLASQNGSEAMVARLLKAGAQPNLGKPFSSVMVAARTGNVAVVKALLDHGGDVNAREADQGQTALMWAAVEKHHDVVRLLVSRGADIRLRTADPSARGSAGSGGGPMGFGRAGSNGLSPNGFTALLFAARVGHLESVRILLDAGADPNDTTTDRMSALVLATYRANLPVAQLLLERGADPNAAGAGFTALHWAAGSWENDTTTNNITTDRPDYEWYAAAGLKEGKTDFVKALLAHGADPNVRMTRAPIRTGSSKNLDLTELHGATAFLVAASAGDTEIMRLLVDKGADVHLGTTEDPKADHGLTVGKTTPLMAAAGLGRVLGENMTPERASVEAAKMILELGGADVNAVDTMGQTALHYAAYNRRDLMVQFLIDHGAALDIKNVYGETPLWLAEMELQFAAGGLFEVRRSDTGEILRKAGAKPIPAPYKLRPMYWFLHHV
ncbi:MAG: ankyrin repeat domain-containing protein [Vicinamibacterales bacterium]